MSLPRESGQNRTQSEPPQTFPGTQHTRHTQSEPITSRLLGLVGRHSHAESVSSTDQQGRPVVEDVVVVRTGLDPVGGETLVGDGARFHNVPKRNEGGRGEREDNPYFPPSMGYESGRGGRGTRDRPLPHGTRDGLSSTGFLNDLETSLPSTSGTYSSQQPLFQPLRQPGPIPANTSFFDPWSRASVPSPRLYPPVPQSPSLSSGAPPPYNYSQEHVWSRAYQEQHLALQQRQARQTLQLRLQQQDEWLQQDQYQRQNYENLRASQGGQYSPHPPVLSTPPHPYVRGPIRLSTPSSVVEQVHLPRLRQFQRPPTPSSFDLNANYNNTARSGGPPPTPQAPLREEHQPLDSAYGQRTTLFDQGGQVVAQATSTVNISHSPAPSRLSMDSRAPSTPSWQSPSTSPSAPRPLVPPFLPPRSPERFPRQRPPSVTLPSPREFGILPQPQSRPAYPTVPPPTRFFPIGNPSMSTLSTKMNPPSMASPDAEFVPQYPLFPTKGTGMEDSLKSGLPAVPNRSPWALWAGNIPSDITHEQLWEFFTSRSAPADATPPTSYSGTTVGRGSPEDDLSTPGVASIHLIARSKCAFINYVSETHLLHAIEVSDGVSLRPLDKRCKPMVCRVRLISADAKSGVGAQRGERMHTNYLREKKARGGGSLGQGAAAVGGVQETAVGSEDSASTTSSFLEREFPKRYFILKSHNIAELSRSVNSGLWTTQSHNEAVLDQAWKTADQVFLIFSANGSGEWFGYAKMSGPVSNLPSPKGPSSPQSRSRSISPSGTMSLIPAEDVSTASRFMLRIPGASPNLPDSPSHEFSIEWINVQRLSFAKTKNISNPFNAGREVKICRDGTEVEPEAGAALIDLLDQTR